MSQATAERPSAPVPKRLSLSSLQTAVGDCRACDLWEGATQAVMGEGAVGATVMLVGEQPGDREDREGHPFVGPAGRVLDRALEEAGIGRKDAYITNVVKHFRYKARGKRRIHQRPDRWQVTACMQWLNAELEMVKAASAIWAKPGPLTAAEWERVRLHPHYTDRVLARCGGLDGLREIASMHHERLDGSGYHRGAGASPDAPPVGRHSELWSYDIVDLSGPPA